MPLNQFVEVDTATSHSAELGGGCQQILSKEQVEDLSLLLGQAGIEFILDLSSLGVAHYLEVGIRVCATMDEYADVIRKEVRDEKNIGLVDVVNYLVRELEAVINGLEVSNESLRKLTKTFAWFLGQQIWQGQRGMESFDIFCESLPFLLCHKLRPSFEVSAGLDVLRARKELNGIGSIFGPKPGPHLLVQNCEETTMEALRAFVCAKPAVGGEARRANYSNPPPENAEAILDFDIDVEKIKAGLDTRTTLMIRNIPNKYAQKHLLKLLDLQFKDKYDFFYLPIDFKNKCNVGYAFINFSEACYQASIVGIYGLLNDKKWEKFNSEKVCQISYARLQGQAALLDHFKSSSVMQQHKQVRPFFTTTTNPSSSSPMTLSAPCLTPEWGGGSEVSSLVSASQVVPSSLNPATVEGSMYLASL